MKSTINNLVDKLTTSLDEKLIEASLRLFKAVPIKIRKKKQLDKKILKRVIQEGILIHPEVVYNYSETIESILKQITKIFGMNGVQMNSTFHKQWKIIKNTDMETLVLKQILHYITTYGFERLGIYSDSSVYIPIEKLKVPGIKTKKFNFILIRGYSYKELKQKALELLESGIALKKESLVDLYIIVKFLDIEEKDLKKIKNKEARVMLYDYLDKFPEHPIEFLRFCIYKAAGTTLLIKNNELFYNIQEASKSDIAELFSDYQRIYGFSKLSSIFYRFKPLFLAFRTTPNLKKYINEIRRLARKFHEPIKIDYLNNITYLIKNNSLDLLKLREELKKVNMFRKIRLLYALKFRTTGSNSILYKVRNGKGYAKEFEFKKPFKIKNAMKIVLTSICADLEKNVKGKKIYIPKNIFYALPATEKQFIGAVPCGSYVSISDNLVAGVHWSDVKHNRIDLDLSTINMKMEKIGWNTAYRTDSGSILYSGDLTAAPKPNGASELFYIERGIEQEYLIYLNYFNFNEDVNVPIKIIVGQKENVGGKFMIDPNDAQVIVNSSIEVKQKILGFITSLSNECRFYFIECDIGRSNVSSGSEYTKKSLEYLKNFYKNTLDLREVLELAGAAIVDTNKNCDIDLSINSLEKDTILKLFY